MRMRTLGCLCSLAALIAQAGTITTTNDPTGSRAAFGGNDTINWDSAGTPFAVLTNPFTILSTNGLSVAVSEPFGTFERRDQPTGWFGNYTGNLVLLWTEGTNGPITITFASPIVGIGFQINPDGSDTSAEFQVFGAGNVSFGTFPLTVNSRTTDSASFVGVQSDQADITKIIIGLGPDQDFSIDQASLITGPVSVPEPAALSMMCIAGGLAFAIRRRVAGSSESPR